MLGETNRKFFFATSFFGKEVREGFGYNTRILHFVGAAKVKDTFVVKVNYLAK